MKARREAWRIVLWITLVAAVACGESSKGGSSNGRPSSTPVASLEMDVVFVVNGGSNNISVIDAMTNQVTATIALTDAPYPHHVYLSADAKQMVLAAPGADLSAGHSTGGGHGSTGPMGAVLKLDTKTGATLAATRLEMMNHNALLSPDEKEIWTSQMMAPGSVLVLDAASLATKSTITVGAMPAEITFSRDGKRAFVANGEADSVTVIDPVQKSVLKTIAVGDNPVGAWPGGDGVMYVDNESGRSLTAIDSTTLEVVRTYDLGFMPGMAATAPGGELWVTDAENGKVVFFTSGGTSKSGDLVTGAGAHGIAFSKDGKTAYVSNQLADSVSIIDVDSHSLRSSISVGSKPNGLVYRSK